MSAIKYFIVSVSAYGENIVKSATCSNFSYINGTFKNMF